MKCLRRTLVALAVLGCLLLALYWARAKVLPPLARWLDVGEHPRPAAYVLVLGGSPRIRPFVAAEILRAGLAGRALISHVKSAHDDLSDLLPPDHEICRRVLLQSGIAADKISYLGHEHGTTYDEACSLSRFLATAPDARVLIVTNDFHTRRARWIFTRLLGPRAGAVSFVSAPSEQFQADNWWRSEEGLDFVVGENLRFLFYVLWYDPITRWASLAALAAAGLAIFLFCRRQQQNPERRTNGATDGTRIKHG
jgi:uncharacterized SAM-binding protein YcdF (DUF218 family)